MKYEENDWVTVRGNLKTSNSSSLIVIPEMKKLSGKSFIIKSTDNGYYELIGSSYRWDDDMLEPALLPKEYIVECMYPAECIAVVTYHCNEKPHLEYNWKYVTCLIHANGKSFTLGGNIADGCGHLQVFTYKQWERIIKRIKTNNMEKRPPLGLIPKKIHDEQVNLKRFEEVCAAIARYYNEGLKINPDWIKEYNDLVVCVRKNYDEMNKDKLTKERGYGWLRG